MTFNLDAAVRPSVDRQAAEQSGRELADALEGEIGDLSPGVGGGVGGIGGAGGGAGIAGAAAGGNALGRTVGGAASGGLAKVALAGAAGFGILTAVQTLASASPALQQTVGLLTDAVELFFRPIGNALSDAIRPLTKNLLDMAKRFNKIANNEGLAVAVGSIAAEAVTSLATGFVNALGNIIGQNATLADWLFAGAGTIALTKLVTGASITSLLTSASISGLLSKAGIGSLLTSTSVGGLLSSVSVGGLLTSVSVGGLLTSVAATGIIGGVAATAIIGSVALSKLIHGDLEMPSGEEGASTVGGDPFDPEEEEQFREAVQQTNTTTMPGEGQVDTSRPPRNGTRNGVVYQNGVAVGTTEELELMREIAENTRDDEVANDRTSATDPATQQGGAKFDPF